MNCQRGLWAGIFVFLILTGCSKDKKLNVEGAYSPVIENMSSDNQPPIRGALNALTALVSNPRGYSLRFLWRATAGTLADSTTETVHWTPPDSIGDYSVTVTVQAHDDLNNVSFSKTRTFQVHVDNEFERWTRSIALQLDVVPPAAGKIYYTEIRDASTGESDVWALATPLGPPEQITRDFWQATAPSTQSDGSRVVFLGRVRSSTGGASLYQVPPTGGDTTNASLVLQWNPGATIQYISAPRFAPSSSMIAYATDTTSGNFGHPKPWMRDAANPNTQPIPVAPTTNGTSGTSTEQQYTYWNPAWDGAGDSLVVESYSTFFPTQKVSRGLYKFSANGNPPTNPEPFSQWLGDLSAAEPDWSPDGQRIVFSKRLPGRTDRDIWIINAHASNPSSARLVTRGPADEFHPRFSSDGSKIFFVSNRVDGYGANGIYDTERRGTNIWSVARFDLP